MCTFLNFKGVTHITHRSLNNPHYHIIRVPFKKFAPPRSLSPGGFPVCFLSIWSADQLCHYLITIIRVCVCVCVPWINGYALRAVDLEENQENILHDGLVGRGDLCQDHSRAQQDVISQ